MGLLAERQERRVQDQLERDYEELRSSVIRSMRSHLRRRGLPFDELDLEGFYNTAWDALYSRLADGEEMENPGGFLVKVACRRAIDDWRGTHDLQRDASVDVNERGVDPDFAKLLDDRRLLREFTEGLREKLTERECQVATLCYIMGYTRPEAAETLGISEGRIQKIMDGATPKIGEFVAVIEGDGWCAEHESMLHAYALNWLDEDGERYQSAQRHLAECPGCRLYVRAKQGLSEVIPPVWLPAELTHSATLETLHHAVHAAWHHNIGLIGSHVVLTHGSAAAGAGAGTGGATAGHVAAGAGAAAGTGSGAGAGGSIFASGIAAKIGVGLAIVGGGIVIAHLADTGSHRSHRPSTVSASPRAAPIKTLLSADPGVSLPPASTARVRAPAGPRAVRHRARLVSHKAPPRRSHATPTISPSAEFSFETGAGRSGQPPSPATPSSPPQNGASGAGSSSAVNSEFGFENR